MRGLASWRKRYTSDIDSVDLGKKKSPRIAFGMQECVHQHYRLCKHMCVWTQFLCTCTGTIIYHCYLHTVYTFTVWLNASCLHITMTTNSAWLTSFIWVCVFVLISFHWATTHPPSPFHSILDFKVQPGYLLHTNSRLPIYFVFITYTYIFQKWK